MAGNPFFSGRIPQDLHDRIQEHCSKTGESKTQVLINALAAYLNHPVKSENPVSTGISHQEFAALQEQVAALQESIQSCNQPVITTDNTEIGLIKEKIELLVTHQERVDIFLACVPMKLQELEEQIKSLSPVIRVDNTDNKAPDVDGNLQLIVIEGRCPSCHSDDMSAIPYESDDQVFFECLGCGWQETYSLSAAKQWGYVPYLSDEETDNGIDNNGDNKKVPSSLTPAALARRLGCHHSWVSKYRLRADFPQRSSKKDPDAIAWKYDRELKLFFPVVT